MNEIEDADDDIDVYKLVFIGSNKEKLNLTLLICHYIFFQIFITVKFH